MKQKLFNIGGISFGILYVLFILFMIFRAEQFPNPEFAYKVGISYGLLSAVIFANADLRNKLFNVSISQFFPKFLLYGCVFLIGFYWLLSAVDPFSGNMFAMANYIPLWLAVINAFVFATTESVIWQGYLNEKIGIIPASLVAGVFHYGVWEGSFLTVIIGAGMLFLFFSVVHNYLDRENEFSAVIGCHTAYNFVKMGLMLMPR